MTIFDRDCDAIHLHVSIVLESGLVIRSSKQMRTANTTFFCRIKESLANSACSLFPGEACGNLRFALLDLVEPRNQTSPQSAFCFCPDLKLLHTPALHCQNYAHAPNSLITISICDGTINYVRRARECECETRLTNNFRNVTVRLRTTRRHGATDLVAFKWG